MHLQLLQRLLQTGDGHDLRPLLDRGRHEPPDLPLVLLRHEVVEHVVEDEDVGRGHLGGEQGDVGAQDPVGILSGLNLMEFPLNLCKLNTDIETRQEKKTWKITAEAESLTVVNT